MFTSTLSYVDSPSAYVIILSENFYTYFPFTSV